MPTSFLDFLFKNEMLSVMPNGGTLINQEEEELANKVKIVYT